MDNLSKINLTDDALKNIFIMAPMLDEAGQNKVFGLMCGLVSVEKSQKDEQKRSKLTEQKRR